MGIVLGYTAPVVNLFTRHCFDKTYKNILLLNGVILWTSRYNNYIMNPSFLIFDHLNLYKTVQRLTILNEYSELFVHIVSISIKTGMLKNKPLQSENNDKRKIILSEILTEQYFSIISNLSENINIKNKIKKFNKYKIRFRTQCQYILVLSINNQNLLKNMKIKNLIQNNLEKEIIQIL